MQSFFPFRACVKCMHYLAGGGGADWRANAGALLCICVNACVLPSVDALRQSVDAEEKTDYDC